MNKPVVFSTACLLFLAIRCTNGTERNSEISHKHLREHNDAPILSEQLVYPYSPILNKTTTDHQKWTYNDESLWIVNFPSCGGWRQSPINLDLKKSKFLYSTGLRGKNYNSFPFYLTLQNNGQGVDAGSTWEIGKRPTIEADFLNGTYIFSSLHWHWGDSSKIGSEHTINNHPAALEMHLIHYNSKFTSIVEAVTSGEKDALAVIGLLFNECQHKTNLGIFLSIIAMKEARSEGKQNFFLPTALFGINFNDNFYTYPGSLTTPPCDEVVQWIVFETPLCVKTQQLDVFRNILVNGKVLSNNYRSVQPTNGRTVFYHGK